MVGLVGGQVDPGLGQHGFADKAVFEAEIARGEEHGRQHQHGWQEQYWRELTLVGQHADEA